jgi:hypothetical protein
MRKWLMGLVCASVCAISAVSGATGNVSGTQGVNPVIVWNRTLLTIVRTPGAQPKTVHSTRSFAILHATIYDAVNAIDRRHKPYLVSVPEVSWSTSEEAAADAAAHEVLVALYPTFKAQLDNQVTSKRAAQFLTPLFRC